MKKLSAYIFALLMTSPAFAADGSLHGEAMQKLAEGIHDAEHASKGGLPQFDPTWFASQIFWLVVSFAILYVFFAKKTLPDISGVIENRKNHIQSDLDMAEKLAAEADAVHDAYQENMNKSQAEASKSLQDAESQMKAKAEKSAEEFRMRSEKEITDAEARIEAAKDSAMNDMNNIVAETASVAVEKIIGQNADVKQVKAIVDNMSALTKSKAA